MGHNFRSYDRDTPYLLPPSIQDWVAEGSLARFVQEVAERLDGDGRFQGFYAAYRPDGRGGAAYHPLAMIQILLYGYCQGITSSRKLSLLLENDVSMRFLSGNQQVDFRTIALFRQRHLMALEGLFVEILDLCREAGLAKLGRVALDGRKVAGNAALDQNRTLDGLRDEVHKMLGEAEQTDAREDDLFGADRRGDELPEELRTAAGRGPRIEQALQQRRLQRLEEARNRLEETAEEARAAQTAKIERREAEERETGRKKRGRKPKKPDETVDNSAKANRTDPDSRILKGRHGFVQGYNGQAMVDCESQVIVAQALTQDENDLRQLKPMLQTCEEQAGDKPRQVLADAGYFSDENAQLETEETELFLNTQKDYKQRKAARENLAPTPLPENPTRKEKMEHKLNTPEGRAIYKQRGSTVEPVFGQMITRGLRQFYLRGLKRVQTEWALWCATHNLLKLWRAGAELRPKQAPAPG